MQNDNPNDNESILFEMETARFKFTVQEISSYEVIATRWEKDYCLEVDRCVKVFETSGGAFQGCLELIKEVAEGD